MPVSQKHIKVLLLPVLILSFFTSCQESVFRSPQKTDELFVYEGLPHPMRENSYFEKEKNRKDVMEIDGHWFYQPKVKASGESHDDLMNLLLDESGFHMPESNVPPKDCGPFHPDYAIMWNSEGAENYLMICYTCGEAKIINGGRVQTFEMNAYKMESLANLLANFQANRQR